jgi:hypothetical protein
MTKHSFHGLSHLHENIYDHAKGEDANDENCSRTSSRSASPVLFYLENRNLAICAFIISLLLLLLIGLGIFLLNKLIRPVIINTTVNNHYGMINISNATTTTSTATVLTTMQLVGRTTISSPVKILVKQSSADLVLETMKNLIDVATSMPCASDRWGKFCEFICKPCGLGTCDSNSGQCICPMGIYGEFCDLWKGNQFKEIDWFVCFV